jgi:ATP-binding cassette subfamily B protein
LQSPPFPSTGSQSANRSNRLMMSTAREQNLFAGVRELMAHCSAPRRKHLRYVLALMIVGAFAELATIGAVLPFLALLADPGQVTEFASGRWLMNIAGISRGEDLVLVAAVIFACVAILAGAVRLMLAWSSQAFVFRFGHELGVELQRRILSQPYTYHVMTNSSQAVGALDKLNALVLQVVLPAMVGASSVLISLFLLVSLLVIDWVTATSAAAIFCLTYILVSKLTQRSLSANAMTINQSYPARIQAAQESYGAIRDILLDDSQPEYVRHFAAIDLRLRNAQIVNSFIGAAPRFIMEAAGMVLIAILALLLSDRPGGLVEAIPILGALALGAQRLLPLLQQVYYGWAQLRGHEAVLYDVLGLLRLPMQSSQRSAPAALPRWQTIDLDGLEFRYPGRDEPVLKSINLTIAAGSRVALIGKTGSGKSTLVDILMGLLEPTSGVLRLDGTPLTGEHLRAWQATVAHVPQSIFLADATIGRNIAFGAPAENIDLARVHAAAKQAQLHDFVMELPDQYETEVGERGVRLSGGQRQRLGLARALYKRSSILVLDEATSALDEATEAAVMRSLQGLDGQLTVIMIAHRLSTIANCDLVVRLDNGRIVKSGSYQSVVVGERVGAA